MGRATLLKAIQIGLEAMGAQGLFWSNGIRACGCGLANLAPCGSLKFDECCPAWRDHKGCYHPIYEPLS